MELSTVVGILVIILAVVLLMKVFGKVVSFVFSTLGIIAVVWLVVVGLRWMDEGNVRENLLDSNNLFVLEDEEGSLITGFATKEGAPEPDLSTADDAENPNSKLYDDYYKVVFVKKDALPEKISLMMDAADDADKQNLFRSYVDNELLEGDFVTNIIEEEKEGNIEVHKETLAFRHGVREVISP